MRYNWTEINTRYDAIKDHKPRASKKLKELGEILAAAYKLDPDKADEMWQYIIELNIDDNIDSSRFYIAQVFKKITENISITEAADFVSMRPERVRLMLLRGYDGLNLVNCAYIVIGNQVLNNRLDDAIETLSILEEKYETQLLTFYTFFNTLCSYLEDKAYQYANQYGYDIPKENMLGFYELCLDNFQDQYIHAIALGRSCLLSELLITDKEEAERILYYLADSASKTKCGIDMLFYAFLYFERDVVGKAAEEILAFFCNETESIRLSLGTYDKKEIMANVNSWYRGLIIDSYKLKDVVFEKEYCGYFIKTIFHEYMYKNDWKTFVHYLTIGLNKPIEKGSQSYLEFIKEEIRDYLSVKNKEVSFENGKCWVINESTYVNYMSSIDRPRITEDNVGDFIRALDHACILTTQSSVNGQLVDIVRSFVAKETGACDAPNTICMDVDSTKPEKCCDYAKKESTQSTPNKCKLSELEILCEYAKKESARRSPYDNSYNWEYGFYRKIQLETETYGAETGKLLAKQPQVLSFLFLHDAHSFSIKADIILGALLGDNYPAALKCVDYMIETATYPNFLDSNSWSMEMKNTLTSVLSAVYRENNLGYFAFSDGITSTVTQIVQKCLPYLKGIEAIEVRAALLKLKSDGDDQAEFIRQLMREVDNYTAKKKPKGCFNRYNDFSVVFSKGIEALSFINRMDVVAQIIRIIADRRDNFSASIYESSLTRFLNVPVEQLLEIYSFIPDVYYTYIEESTTTMALNLLKYYSKLGNHSVYRNLKNQVLQKHGYIDGII